MTEKNGKVEVLDELDRLSFHLQNLEDEICDFEELSSIQSTEEIGKMMFFPTFGFLVSHTRLGSKNRCLTVWNVQNNAFTKKTTKIKSVITDMIVFDETEGVFIAGTENGSVFEFTLSKDMKITKKLLEEDEIGEICKILKLDDKRFLITSMKANTLKGKMDARILHYRTGRVYTMKDLVKNKELISVFTPYCEIVLSKIYENSFYVTKFSESHQREIIFLVNLETEKIERVVEPPISSSSSIFNDRKSKKSISALSNFSRHYEIEKYKGSELSLEFRREYLIIGYNDGSIFITSTTFSDSPNKFLLLNNSLSNDNICKDHIIRLEHGVTSILSASSQLFYIGDQGGNLHTVLFSNEKNEEEDDEEENSMKKYKPKIINSVNIFGLRSRRDEGEDDDEEEDSPSSNNNPISQIIAFDDEFMNEENSKVSLILSLSSQQQQHYNQFKKNKTTLNLITLHECQFSHPKEKEEELREQRAIYRDVVIKKLDEDFKSFFDRNCYNKFFGKDEVFDDGDEQEEEAYYDKNNNNNTINNLKSKNDVLEMRSILFSILFKQIKTDLLNSSEIQDYGSLIKHEYHESLLVFNFISFDPETTLKYREEEDREIKKIDDLYLYFGQSEDRRFKEKDENEEDEEDEEDDSDDDDIRKKKSKKVLVPHGFGIILKCTKRKKNKRKKGLLYILSPSSASSDILYTPYYLGYFEYGKFNAQGRLYDPKTQNIQYEGEFCKGLRDGRGIEYQMTKKEHDNVVSFQGEFRKGERHGKGENFDLETGKVTQAYWTNGKLNEDSLKQEFDCPLIPYPSVRVYLNDDKIEGKGAFGIVYRVRTKEIKPLFYMQLEQRGSEKDSNPALNMMMSIRDEFLAVKIMNAESMCHRDILFQKTKRGVTLCQILERQSQNNNNKTSSSSSSSDSNISVSHILKIYGIIKGTRSVGYIMEFCSKSMDKVISMSRKNTDSLSMDKKIDILKQTAKGMYTLHSNNVMHRDLKWGNIMITNDGVIKITDFDTLKEDENKWKMSQQIHNNSSGVGTTGFLAPEVFCGNKYSLKCDVFAFGIMIYGLLRGQNHPFVSQHGTLQKYHKCSCGVSINSILVSRNLDFHVAKHNLRPPLREKELGEFPDFLIQIMILSWDKDPFNRPSFEDILQIFRAEEKKEKCYAIITIRFEEENTHDDELVSLPSTDMLLSEPKMKKIIDWIERKYLGVKVKSLYHIGMEIKTDENVFQLIQSEESPLIDVELEGKLVRKLELSEMAKDKETSEEQKQVIHKNILEFSEKMIRDLEEKLGVMKNDNQRLTKKIKDLEQDKFFIKKTMQGTIRNLRGQYDTIRNQVMTIRQQNMPSSSSPLSSEGGGKMEEIQFAMHHLKKENEQYEVEFKLMEKEKLDEIDFFRKKYTKEIKQLKKSKRKLQRKNKKLEDSNHTYRMNYDRRMSTSDLGLYPTVRPGDIEKMIQRNKQLEELQKKNMELENNDEVLKLKNEKKILMRKNKRLKEKYQNLHKIKSSVQGIVEEIDVEENPKNSNKNDDEQEEKLKVEEESEVDQSNNLRQEVVTTEQGIQKQVEPELERIAKPSSEKQEEMRSKEVEDLEKTEKKAEEKGRKKKEKKKKESSSWGSVFDDSDDDF